MSSGKFNCKIEIESLPIYAMTCLGDVARVGAQIALEIWGGFTGWRTHCPRDLL